MINKNLCNLFLVLLTWFHLEAVIANSLTTSVPQPASVIYYLGDARIIYLSNFGLFKAGQTSSEKVLLKKSFDPNSNVINEIACLRDSVGPSFRSSVFIKVMGATTQISDTPPPQVPNKLSGTGTVAGANGDWTYLSFSMSYQACTLPQCASKVTDTNFVVRGQSPDGSKVSQLIGRKQMFAYDGTPFETYDLEMNEISEDQFNSNAADMGCPSMNEQ